jgi:sugar phosphate isomerase/epimerase
MSKLLINPNINDLDNFLDFAVKNDFFFEIFGFCNPSDLDNEEIVQKHIEIFMPFKDRIYSMHGAFIGLQVTCWDSTIRNASRNRIIQNCEISKTLNIKNLVVHCDKLPYILQQDYTDSWVDACYEFYSEIIYRYDITILMENCWDLSPQPMKQLIEKMNTDKFKGCIDTGHVNCFSKADINEWIDVLAEDLAHFHFNDNQGEIDEHNPAGQGTFDFKTLTKKIEEYNIKPNVVFEMDTYENINNINNSINYLKENKFYPFDN